MTGVLRKATELAHEAHEGQMRKGLDEPYIAHCIRVANMAVQAGLPEEAVAAAILHDVVEDTEVTFERLEAEGFPARTIELVQLLTKWWGPSESSALSANQIRENKRRYYAQIMADPDALVLKLLDRTDNLLDCIRCSDRPFVGRYFRKTVQEFKPLVTACDHPSVVAAFSTARTALEKQLEVEIGWDWTPG